jgi:hypothetical protein
MSIAFIGPMICVLCQQADDSRSQSGANFHLSTTSSGRSHTSTFADDVTRVAVQDFKSLGVHLSPVAGYAARQPLTRQIGVLKPHCSSINENLGHDRNHISWAMEAS